jgi:pilus assembly protein CpaD
MRFEIVTVARRRWAAKIASRSLLIASFGAALAGCNTTYVSSDPTEGIPLAYQDRHPITVQEGRKALVLFVGSGRGGLSPTQRAEVLAFAHNWQRDATGGVTVDRPIQGVNERAISDSLRETLSILSQAGVPKNGIGIRPYDPHGRVATLRLTYPLMKALAGPCGLWPDDLGPSYETKHYENVQYYNFGCATQRNLAAMVAEPADIVQPRSETSVYRAKRTFANDKWRKGENPSTVYTDPNKGAISEIGK